MYVCTYSVQNYFVQFGNNFCEKLTSQIITRVIINFYQLNSRLL